jgi:hypothetical protein
VLLVEPLLGVLAGGVEPDGRAFLAGPRYTESWRERVEAGEKPCDLGADKLVQVDQHARAETARPDGWHRRNLLDPEQRVVGVGFCANSDDPSGNRLYWTMIVTRPAL